MDRPAAAPLRAPQTAAGAPRAPVPAPSTAPAPPLQCKAAGQVQHLDEPCEFKFVDGGEAEGRVEGYASKFDLLDRGGDIVKPGAFKATIADWKRRKSMPPMLWQHDPSCPIGVWTDLSEDDVGLKAVGQLILDVPQAQIARALIKAKALRGLSIGYLPSKDGGADYDRQTGARFLKKVDLWEISAVTFPMLPEAQITAIKGDFDPRTIERLLRDEAGLSISEAKAAIGVFRKHALREGGSSEPGPREGAAAMLMTLRKATASLR